MITAFIQDPVSLARMMGMEDVTPFGAQDKVQQPVQLRSVNDVAIGGLFTDSANQPDALFNTNFVAGTAQTLLVTWGGTKTSSVSCYVRQYDRIGTVGKYTRVKGTLAPTGAVTEV